MRIRFFQQAEGAKPLRVETYMLPPKFTLDKDRRRVVYVGLSIKMNADLAIACDAKLAAGWEQCETREREIVRVDTSLEVEHTTVNFFELVDSAKPVFSLRNVTVTGMLFRYDKGQTYLYLGMEAFVANHKAIEQFLAAHYGSGLFCEFCEHVAEVSPDQVGGTPSKPLGEAMAEAIIESSTKIAETLGEGTSMEIISGGKSLGKIEGRKKKAK